jgi:hypothetical protein
MTKTKATRTAKPAAAKAARAKAAATETVKSAVQARTGNGLVVTTSTDRSIVIQRQDRHTQKLAQIGQPVAPLDAYLATQPKPAAKLATGVDAKSNPHSAKAVADQRDKGTKAAKPAATAKPAKAAKEARKAERKARTDPATKVTVLVKPKDAGVTGGRLAKLTLMAKCKTLGQFLGQTVTDSSGKDHTCKMDAVQGMLRRGHIRLG